VRTSAPWAGSSRHRRAARRVRPTRRRHATGRGRHHRVRNGLALSGFTPSSRDTVPRLRSPGIPSDRASRLPGCGTDRRSVRRPHRHPRTVRGGVRIPRCTRMRSRRTTPHTGTQGSRTCYRARRQRSFAQAIQMTTRYCSSNPSRVPDSRRTSRRWAVHSPDRSSPDRPRGWRRHHSRLVGSRGWPWRRR